MRWLIAALIIITSSILGLFAASGTVNVLPGYKEINPKPEKYITKIDENGQIVYFKEDENGNQTPVEEEFKEKYAETDSKLFLLMGTDVVYSTSRKKINSLNGRTDSIIVVKLKENGIDLLSIPRDTRVNIPGHGYEKINSANVFGGPELVKKTIENWIGLHIEDYALINTFGVVKFVDLFGGIQYNVPKKMYYSDRAGGLYINIKAGPQTLNGTQVHNYLRFRHDALGDFNRIKRQQEIFKVILDQFVKPSNILKLPSVMKVMNDNMDTNVSIGEIIFLANKVLSNNNLKNNISMHTIPGSGKMIKSGWYFIPDEIKTNSLLKELNLTSSNNLYNKDVSNKDTSDNSSNLELNTLGN